MSAVPVSAAPPVGPQSIAIVVLGQQSVTLAYQIKSVLPSAIVYGLVDRTTGVEVSYVNFGETLRDLFAQGTAIIGLCAAGILIRTLAPALANKFQEPPVLAIAEDGSAVVPLLGGVQGVNDLARLIATHLQVAPAITTSGDLRFRTALLSPPPGYHLANPDDAKTFIADLLAGATVKLEGEAPWLTQSQLPIDPNSTLTIQVTVPPGNPSPHCLVYHPTLHLSTSPPPHSPTPPGKLAIVGTGPGSAEWMSPQVSALLTQATDWVGYSTYLNLVEPLRTGQQRHDSDNRVELERARLAIDLAASGRSVVVVSSGDPGIYAMASAVFEVLDREANPDWAAIEIQVAPGISAMQAAAAQIGAPIGHDFCALSLSDILKPWETIAQRISAAAQADLVIAFYNPVSTQRTWQLSKAQALLLQVRSPTTPVVLGRNLGRPGQAIAVITLAELDAGQVDMRTIVLVGSSKTRTIPRPDGGVWVYTPRYYE
jgi:cobalt-precorrin 5A hydrolase / precorrin-3B C17-methyltransferase